VSLLCPVNNIVVMIVFVIFIELEVMGSCKNSVHTHTPVAITTGELLCTILQIMAFLDKTDFTRDSHIQ